ncbi:Ornithine carbamoyltransferase [Nitrospira sp. KM1]|uniref:ornithine carbamoyltransferase n=1 Tax=Nitrospira sp. KM1 TaxID=1936990 RepID=UPI0013A764A9|nr:ornithine carbamoyltransferase [Nitrospira sp. KM1]BCA55628.1 Ornithine carbamoyltransferase [Nitrospira sp. KM1]
MPTKRRHASEKDLIDVATLSRREIEDLLALAARLKDKQHRGISHQLLQGKTLGLLFQKPSTRTRVSFEAGMNQLGGHALVLPMSDIQLSRGESVADTARVLSRYLDGIVIRTYDHATVQEWARESTMPVINGLTDLSHPCQALSDLLTIREKKGRLKGVKIAYVGDGNNVANSLIEAAAKTGMSVALGCPSGYQPDQHVVDLARLEAAKTGATIDLSHDPHTAVKEADVIYADVWISMGREREQARRLKVLAPYQVNMRLVGRAKPDVIVMHCLPAHRGEEITADVLDGPQSVVIDQAENRLHMQKAILTQLLGERKHRTS